MVWGNDLSELVWGIGLDGGREVILLYASEDGRRQCAGFYPGYQEPDACRRDGHGEGCDPFEPGEISGSGDRSEGPAFCKFLGGSAVYFCRSGGCPKRIKCLLCACYGIDQCKNKLEAVTLAC